MYVANGILEWTDFPYFAVAQHMGFDRRGTNGKSVRSPAAPRVCLYQLVQ
jgi:hypothetical protein